MAREGLAYSSFHVVERSLWCGGGETSAPPPTFTVGATVTGLSGSGLVLQLNGGSNLAVAASGKVAFATLLAGGSSYSVIVLTQPSSPAQTCVVNNGTGAVSNVNVTAIAVSCTTNSNLVVQKFGSGIVADSQTPLNCGTSCSGSYTLNTSVVLQATPDPGWLLDHWIGCDSIGANTCTVQMSKDRVVYPTFATTAPSGLKTGVKVLSAETVGQIDSIAGDVIVFGSGASEASALRVGDVFVSMVGAGMAKRVLAVSSLPGSPIYVTTANAPLEDVLTNGTLIFHRRLTTSDLVSAPAAGLRGSLPTSSVQAGATASDSSTFHISIDSSEDPDFSAGAFANILSVKGSVDITFEPDFAVSLGLFRVNEFKAALITTATENLTVTALSPVAFYKLPKPFVLKTYVFAPQVVFGVVIVPTVTVYLNFSVDAKGELTTGVTVSSSATAGMQYRAGAGWDPISWYEYSATFDVPTITTALDTKGIVGAELLASIYGVAGPAAQVEGYLEGTATLTTPAGSNSCLDWGLSWGADLKAGIDSKVLSYVFPDFNTEVYLTLFDKKFPLLSGSIPATCSDTNSPSSPTGLVLTPMSARSIGLTWAPSTDDTFVSKYKIYRDSVAIGETGNALFVDTFLKADTTYCYKIVAVDSSGNKSVASSAVCAHTLSGEDRIAPSAPTGLSVTSVSTHSLALAWTPSTDNVKVAGYAVQRDGMPVASVRSSAATDNGLFQGARYCYSVVAFDDAGNTSAASAQICGTTATVGEWSVEFKCAVQSTYVTSVSADIDTTGGLAVQAPGTGNDYNGTALEYILFGTVDPSTKVFSGQVTWAFAGNSCSRRDTFAVSLANTDSGDVDMNQVAVCGCAAQVRILKSSVTPLSVSREVSRSFAQGAALSSR